MDHLLNNPVYNALITGDRLLSQGSENAKYFEEAVSPFAGFPQEHRDGFDELFALLPAGRRILFASTTPIETPREWSLLHHVPGIQMVFTEAAAPVECSEELVPLTPTHIPQMLALAKLTKPGPFGPRTIEFGHYYGVFAGETLVAMTGQRLHIGPFSEISAVCTHPDHLGKGYATALVHHQLHLILAQGQIPVLHVRADNQRAIAVYERMGFRFRRPMHFYFLQK